MTTTAITSKNEAPRAFDLIRHPKEGQTELLLVRHGQTEGNAKHLFIGSTDLPLDPLGERQARRIGDRFAQIGIDALISSPLRRARQTASEIMRTTRREIEIVPGLSEIDFGTLEGYTIEQVVAQFPEIRDKLDMIEDVDIAWPGGESRHGFNARVRATFYGILERYVNQTVAVVCHGGVIGSFVAQIEGGSPNDWATYAFQNCSLTRLVVTHEQTLIHFSNDYSHLDEVQRETLRLSPRLMKEETQ